MIKRCAAILLCLALLSNWCLATEPADATDWPMWRGPAGDGRSTESGLPTRWSATEQIAWKTRIPGVGHSSPIVSGNRVFVTTALEEETQRGLICLDRSTGTIIWQKNIVRSLLEKKHRLNSYASATPATDGKLVFVSFFEQPRIQIAAFDFDGKEVWRVSPGEFYSVHGFCSSPVIYKDLLILNGDQDAKAYLVAFDKATGKERWRTDRPNKTRSYCTPIIVDLAGKPQMMLSGSKCVASYNPITGEQYWIIDGPTEQMVASLVHTKGIVFVTGGFPELHVLGIDPTGAGNVSKSHVHWRDGQSKGDRRLASYVPSPVAFADWFFLVSDGGLATCFDAKSGERRWQEKLGKHHSASAVAGADGMLYFTSDAGETFVIKAGGTCELVAKNVLGEEVRSSPAISGGQIFIRGVDHLYCIGAKGGN